MPDASKKSTTLGSYFWNTMYAGLSATQSAIILIFAARVLPLRDCGIITIGFTLANLMMVLAIYGMRNYQVTDVHEENAFSDYFACRVVTVGGTVAASALFLLVMTLIGKYTPDKSLLVFEIILMKMVDGFENVYVGRFQQKGFLNVGARIASLRLALAIGVVCIGLLLMKNVRLAFLAGFLVSAAADFILIPQMRLYADLHIVPLKQSKTALKKLLTIGISLCIGTTLLNYVGNAPKYLVDFFLADDELQAKIGYVMLPMFVITLLNNFIMQPTVKSLGDAWVSGDTVRFRRMILRHITILTALSVAVLVAGIWIGLPLMEWMYSVELEEFRGTFCLLFVGGTLYTLSAYFGVLLTTVRRQNVIVWGCAAAILVFVVFGKAALVRLGTTGLGALYIAANALLLAFFAIGLVRKKKTNGGISC